MFALLFTAIYSGEIFSIPLSLFIVPFFIIVKYPSPWSAKLATNQKKILPSCPIFPALLSFIL